MKRVLLATRSNDKAREIRAILAHAFHGSIVTLEDAGISASAAEDDIEVFETFLENAHAKAAYFLRLSGLPVIADDSGISVDALSGAPGVRSRRYAGQSLHGEEQDAANNGKLLDALRDQAHPERTAHYTCAAVLHTPDGFVVSAVGIRSGFILTAPRGPHGFGYDPLFLDPATGQSFGEMDPVRKNDTSHRARAFRALSASLPHDS